MTDLDHITSILLQDIQTKQCKVCGVAQSIESFTPAKRGLYGVATICKKCDASRAVAYRRRQAHDKALERVVLHPLHYASPYDLAYIAGIVDGEGSISICRNGERKQNYSGRVLVTNTSTSLMIYLQEVTGIGRIRLKGHYDSNKFKKTKQCYEWSCTTRQCLIFLRAIYPYLLIKREQAILVIALGERKEVKVNKYLTEEERLLRHEMFLQCKLLNAKG